MGEREEGRGRGGGGAETGNEIKWWGLGCNAVGEVYG
jgi:hypothetical protein